MRVLCDRMLGRLARWLRLMGVDSIYPREVDDGVLVRMAREQGRVLLTRDRGLAERLGANGLYIPEHGIDGQMAAFVRAFGMPYRWFSRCTVCNGLLSEDEPAGMTTRVPEAVLYRHATFWVCRSCGRVYWPGTHFISIRRRLLALSGGVGPERGGSDKDEEAFIRRESTPGPAGIPPGRPFDG